MSDGGHVLVPDIGDSTDIPVIEIFVKPGDRVTKDMPLVMLESDKATFDVPSPADGIVGELEVTIGARVSAGSLLLTLNRVLPASAAPPTEVRSHISRAEAGEAMAFQIKDSSPVAASPRVAHGSPSIRRMAREFGIDLSAVPGTGPRGRIIRDDLHKFVKIALENHALGAGSDTSGALKLAPWPKIDFSKSGPIEREPLSKIRKLAAANLARNALAIPHVTNFEDADITELDAFRQSLNARAQASDVKLTVLPFLIKAAAVTLGKYRQFNSSLEGDELVLKRYCHIGFAADTPNGLVVPVIRDVDSKGILELAIEAARLAAQAREGSLTPADMQGGCFTISSLGGVGGTGFTPIINAPEVAILGLTRAQMRPLWNGKEFQPRLVLPLMLSWDHRVVDGVAAANFLVNLAGILGDLRKILL